MDQATSRSLVVARSWPASSCCAGGAFRLALLALAPPAQFHTGSVVRARHEAQALVEAALTTGAEELDLEHARLLHRGSRRVLISRRVPLARLSRAPSRFMTSVPRPWSRLSGSTITFTIRAGRPPSESTRPVPTTWPPRRAQTAYQAWGSVAASRSEATSKASLQPLDRKRS